MTVPSLALDFARDIAGDLVLSESRGDDVRALREKNGLTQSELAELLGTTRERVSRVENGHVPPTVDFVENLSRVMALGEAVREMKVTGEFDSRAIRRTANKLGLGEEETDLLVIRGLASLDRKRRGLIKELEK